MMATTKKRPKGRKKSAPAEDSAVAVTPPELQPPKVEAASEPPAPKRPEPAPKEEPKDQLPKVSVSPVQDPKAKRLVQGKVDMNFKYGGQSVQLRTKKQTRIPVVAFDHCKRNKLI